MSTNTQRLPRPIAWSDIQPGDLLRTISINRYAAVVEDRTGVVDAVGRDEIWTPDDLVLGRFSEVVCIILLGRTGNRWESRRHG
ncbi:MAG: hypothetical protein Q4B08_08160 [Propionibacteriaceae bacterium]|nr:hypothetical protein [Propionibacteriaceae bacterium]